MKKKTKLFILSSLLLISFFVPNFNWEGFAMSGFDFVVSSQTPDFKYFLLVIPACALCLIATALSDSPRIVANRLFLQAPLMILISIFIFFYFNAESKISLGTLNPLKMFSIGLWIALSISLVLVFKKKTITY
jgi:hypothetical protein